MSGSVSVAVSCYNHGQFLDDCVMSVLRQECVDVDVSIIDDASTDDSVPVAERLAEADGRVTLVRHAASVGHIETYNEGLAAAQGDFAIVLSAGDLLPPGSLARATALLQAHPQVGLAYGRPVEFTSTPPPARTRVRGWSVWDGHDWIARRCRVGRNCIVNPEVVMRRAVLEKVGLFRPELPHSGDMELWMRIAAVSDIGRVNGPYQGFYRSHDTSMMRTRFANVLTDLTERRRAFDVLFDTMGDCIDDAEELRSDAYRAMAREALGHACRAYDQGRVDSELVEHLLALAQELDPGLRGRHAWRGLERRRAVGPNIAPRMWVFQAAEIVHEIEDRLRWRRWQWSGL
jgi:GT2 family glycosyltransferase